MSAHDEHAWCGRMAACAFSTPSAPLGSVPARLRMARGAARRAVRRTRARARGRRIRCGGRVRAGRMRRRTVPGRGALGRRDRGGHRRDRDRRGCPAGSRRSHSRAAAGPRRAADGRRRTAPAAERARRHGRVEAFLAGAAAVAARGWTFDACVRDRQLPDVSALAASVPGLRIVLDHLGKPPSAPPGPRCARTRAGSAASAPSPTTRRCRSSCPAFPRRPEDPGPPRS